MSYLTELSLWLATLERPFVFLLTLPFLVAAVGLAAYFVGQRSGRV